MKDISQILKENLSLARQIEDINAQYHSSCNALYNAVLKRKSLVGDVIMEYLILLSKGQYDEESDVLCRAFENSLYNKRGESILIVERKNAMDPIITDKKVTCYSLAVIEDEKLQLRRGEDFCLYIDTGAVFSYVELELGVVAQPRRVIGNLPCPNVLKQKMLSDGDDNGSMIKVIIGLNNVHAYMRTHKDVLDLWMIYQSLYSVLKREDKVPVKGNTDNITFLQFRAKG